MLIPFATFPQSHLSPNEYINAVKLLIFCFAVVTRYSMCPLVRNIVAATFLISQIKIMALCYGK